MKKTIERLIAVALLISVLMNLVACGGHKPGDQKAEVELEKVDPTGQEVVFWYQHNREREEELLNLIETFNRTNYYGIKVRGEYAGRYDDIYNKMIVGLQGGTLPHLVVAYQNQARAYYQAGGIVDLTPYMESPRWGLSEEERKDFVEAFLEQDRIAGVQIGFPPNRSMEVLYYNLDWLKELGYGAPPHTWAEFAEMCRKAKRQPFSKSTDKRRSLGFLLDVDASRLASIVFSLGGRLVNAEGTAYTLDTPQMRTALELIVELKQEGVIDLVGEEGEDQKEFSVGQVLFALRSSSGLPFFATAVESGVGFNWDVAALPCDDNQLAVNVYGASISICKTTPAAQLAAWLFLKWFTEPAQQARWVRVSNYFPVRKSTAAGLVDYFASNPRYRSAFQLLEYGVSEPTLAGYEQVRRLIQEAMVDVLEGEEIDRVLKRLQRAAEQTQAVS